MAGLYDKGRIFKKMYQQIYTPPISIQSNQNKKITFVQTQDLTLLTNRFSEMKVSVI